MAGAGAKTILMVESEPETWAPVPQTQFVGIVDLTFRITTCRFLLAVVFRT